MGRTIQERERIECESFGLTFENSDGIGGYSFDCDKDGNVFPFKNDAAKENYEYCLANPDKCIPTGVTRYSWHYTQPKVIECDNCRNHVALEHFTNTCKCGADYNSCGTLLGPRSQWGEETGECLADILRIP
jgi:hypothetical protein